jgi:hypothetical protein
MTGTNGDGRPSVPPAPGPLGLDPPDMAEALVTAGAVIHWLQADAIALFRLAHWAEHCPGDLAGNLPGLRDYLWACHEILAPDCGDER